MLDKNSLQGIIAIFKKTQHAEDVFGDWKVPDKDKLATQYKIMIRAIFPDHYRTEPDLLALAEEAFKLLGAWRQVAEDRITAGTYGKRDAIKPVKITTKTGVFEARTRYASDSIAEFYLGENLKTQAPVLLKVVRSPKNNDLMTNEAAHLKLINEKGGIAPIHIPVLHTSFEMQQGKEKKRVSIFDPPGEFISLAQIIKAYPQGVDSADMAWMFNRMLGALMASHQAGIIHGAIAPENILYRLRDHNGLLINWVYSVKKGETVKAIIPARKPYYAPEILAKMPATEATDIYMLVHCMVELLCGRPQSYGQFSTESSKVPRAIRGLLCTGLLNTQAKRPEDAFALYQEFGEVLRKLYGPKKFRPFVMPPTK